MMKRAWLLLLVALPILLLGSVRSAAGSPAEQTTGVTLAAPVSCPPSGCAAGQTLSLRLEYELGAYDATIPSPGSNVKVCLYIPTAWVDATQPALLDSTGGVTGGTYTNVTTTTGCPQDVNSPVAGYSLAAAGEALFNSFVFTDTLGFEFRIQKAATGAGSVLMRVFEQTAPGVWTRTHQAFTSSFSTTPAAATAYLAASPASCPGAPCYLNSAADRAGGAGTGLRDALDAAPANGKVVVSGSVALKESPVIVSAPVILEGQNDATLTTNATACNGGPLLQLNAGATVRNLNLNDGACSGALNRDLIAINSADAVLIESNDLTGGKDAISVTENTGNLTVRYNQLSGNSGYALLWSGTALPNGGALDLVGNNLGGNRSGEAVDCMIGASAAVANRRANHNWWGSPAGVNIANTHCNITANKQLGAPALQNPTAPGVDVARYTVTTSLAYTTDNLVSFVRSADGADYDIFVVDHGMQFPTSLPFTSASAGNPNPCSAAYDVFLADGAAPGGTLTLGFKYNRSTACLAAIESASICGQTTTPSVYPLWWYEPGGTVTAGWDTTGQNPAGSGAGGATGQVTSCELAIDEVRVAIDASGRPNLANDLNFAPFMVGLTMPTTFRTLASDKTVTVNWTTTFEPDIAGFYVLRSLSATGPFDPITDLIPRRGNALVGSDYAVVDAGRTNGVTNYYRLKIMRSDGTFFFSDINTIVPNVATITPTPTRTATWTATVTRTATLRPLPSATRAVVPTRPLATSTRAAIPTTRQSATPVGTRGSLTPGTPGTATATLNPALTLSATLPGTAATTATFPATATSTPEATLTPTASVTPTRTPAEAVRNASGWISLMCGLLLSGGILGGLAWLFFRRRPPAPLSPPDSGEDEEAGQG